MLPIKRGLAVEKILGGNLPKNFPVIDKFINGTTESIKSIDLGAKTYKNLRSLKSTLIKYVDKLESIKGASFDGETILESNIKKRVLTVGIEEGKGNAAQSKIFSEIVDYSKSKGIKFQTKIIK